MNTYEKTHEYRSGGGRFVPGTAFAIHNTLLDGNDHQHWLSQTANSRQFAVTAETVTVYCFQEGVLQSKGLGYVNTFPNTESVEFFRVADGWQLAHGALVVSDKELQSLQSGTLVVRARGGNGGVGSVSVESR